MGSEGLGIGGAGESTPLLASLAVLQTLFELAVFQGLPESLWHVRHSR